MSMLGSLQLFITRKLQIIRSFEIPLIYTLGIKHHDEIEIVRCSSVSCLLYFPYVTQKFSTAVRNAMYGFY